MESILSEEKLNALLGLLKTVREIPGVIVELGVYKGGTLKAMAESMPWKTCYGFDTFMGLPQESWKEGEPHNVGEFSVSITDVMAEMPGNVVLIPGLFPRSADANTTLSAGWFKHIVFAHVDMDYEKSTEDAIDWLVPRMVKGGIILFDDWHWPQCPGVDAAIDRSVLTVKELTQHQCYTRFN